MKPLPVSTLASSPRSHPFRYPRAHFVPLLPAIATWFRPTGHLNAGFLDTVKDQTLPVPVEVTFGTPPVFSRHELPLRFFFLYLQNRKTFPGSLYLAQCPVPPDLVRWLPTPADVPVRNMYACNLWMSRAADTTNTPLHKDPNGNLFVQLAGRKVVRLFEPEFGKELLGGEMRLSEEDMVKGRADETVWGQDESRGWEVELGPGDGVFLPEGWWHAVRSKQGEGVTASVNWWFR